MNNKKFCKLKSKNEMPLITAPKVSKKFYDSIFYAGYSAFQSLESKKNKVICFTSLSNDLNKSVLAINLAMLFSEKKHKTLLIDFDHNFNYVAQKLGLSNDKGCLQDFLEGKTQIENVVVNINDNFDCILAGENNGNINLLNDDLTLKIAEYCTSNYTVTIFNIADANSAKCQLISSQSDGVVLAVNPQKDAVSDVIKCKKLYGDEFLGTIDYR